MASRLIRGRLDCRLLWSSLPAPTTPRPPRPVEAVCEDLRHKEIAPFVWFLRVCYVRTRYGQLVRPKGRLGWRDARGRG